MRDVAKHVPPVEELRKKKEEDTHNAWERFLLKNQAITKRQQQVEKQQK